MTAAIDEAHPLAGRTFRFDAFVDREFERVRSYVSASARGPLVVAGPDASLQHAARLMDLHHVDAVVVTEGGAPTGLVTERDLVVRGLARGLSGDAPLRAVMTPAPVTVDAVADAAEAFGLLRERALHRLPVVAGGKVVAILTLDDFAVEPPAELTRLVHTTADQN